MKIVIVVISFIAFVSNAYCQTIRLRFEILDNKAGFPIYYAQAWLSHHDLYAYSGKDGMISMDLIEEEGGRVMDDTLNISAISYKKISIPVKELIEIKEKKIYLEPDPLVLPVFTFRLGLKEKKIILGRNRRPLNMYQSGGVIGRQSGRYFINEEEKEGEINRVKIYITKIGHYNAPFRLRVYSVNDQKKPDKDILIKSIIISAEKPNSWVTIDLSEYHIPFYKEGVIVALEYIFSEEKYFYKRQDGYMLYGPSIGCVTIKNPDVQRIYSFVKSENRFVWSSGEDYYSGLKKMNYYYPEKAVGYADYFINIEVIYP